MIIDGKENVTGLKLAKWLKENLVGQRVVSIERSTSGDAANYCIKLENGVLLTVDTNEGCGGCMNGWSSLKLLEHGGTYEGAVMNVDYKEAEDFDYSEEFSIFIYLSDNSTYEFQGHEGAGNGYYGLGYWVKASLQK